jgi:predicted amidophosphoribosyltransferase
VSRSSRYCAPLSQNRTYVFDRAGSFAVYQSAVVRAILLLKFEQIEPLGAWFAERLAEVVNSETDRRAADAVVPVPLHRERERERGYNQAALLSKPLAKRLRLPPKLWFWCAREQAGAEFGRAMGVCAWRFCHTSRQPG